MEIYLYIATVFLAVTLFYVISRAVDYAFTKKDDQRRYGMAKGLIQCGGNQVKLLSREVTKQINDALVTMVDKMGEL